MIYTLLDAIDPDGLQDRRQNSGYDFVPDVLCIAHCDFARGEVDKIKVGRRHVVSGDNLETTNHVETSDKKNTEGRTRGTLSTVLAILFHEARENPSYRKPLTIPLDAPETNASTTHTL